MDYAENLSDITERRESIFNDMQRSETTPIPKDQLLDERETHIEYQKSGKKILQKDNWHTEEKIFSDKMGELWKRKTIYKIKDDYVIPEGIHSTLYIPHSTLQTLHFYTLHVTLRFRPSRLCTFHTLRCMEPWPSLSFMLRALTGLLSSTSVFFTAVLLPALPNHSDAEGGPLKLPQLLVSMLAMLKFVRLFGQQCTHTF